MALGLQAIAGMLELLVEEIAVEIILVLTFEKVGCLPFGALTSRGFARQPRVGRPMHFVLVAGHLKDTVLRFQAGAIVLNSV